MARPVPVAERGTRGNVAGQPRDPTSDNTLGVTHGALARACHAAYERSSPGRAWNLLRRPDGRLRRFVNRGDVMRNVSSLPISDR
jgi:hypothetical protein